MIVKRSPQCANDANGELVEARVKDDPTNVLEQVEVAKNNADSARDEAIAVQVEAEALLQSIRSDDSYVSAKEKEHCEPVDCSCAEMCSEVNHPVLWCYLADNAGTCEGAQGTGKIWKNASNEECQPYLLGKFNAAKDELVKQKDIAVSAAITAKNAKEDAEADVNACDEDHARQEVNKAFNAATTGLNAREESQKQYNIMINYSPKISADISAELIAAVVDNNKAISSAVEASDYASAAHASLAGLDNCHTHDGTHDSHTDEQNHVHA